MKVPEPPDQEMFTAVIMVIMCGGIVIALWIYAVAAVFLGK